MRTEYAGREIAVKAVLPLLDFLAGYPDEASGLDRIDTTGGRISWDDLCDLLDTAAGLSEDPRQIGAKGLSSTRYQYRQRVRMARAFLTVGDALRFVLYPRNPIDYACLNTAIREEPGRIDIVAYVLEDHRPSSAFFEVMLGAAEELVRQFQLPDGSVTLDVNGRQAHYVVSYAHSTGIVSRFRRWVSRSAYSVYSLLVIRSAYPYLVEGRKMFERQIVERAKLEKGLVDSQQSFEHRMENVGDVIGELDSAGSVAYVSPNLERLTGVTVEEALGNPKRLVHPDDLAAVTANLARVLADPHGGRIEDFRVFDSAGAVCWVELTIRPSFTPRGERKVICVARDVSERRRYRDRREKLDRQLERSRRLEMLGVLAGGIAHDFNNLLLPMLAEADLARIELEDRPKTRLRLEAIESSAQRAADLVRQLMVYSGTEAGHRETIDLAKEAEALLGLIQVSIPPRVELRSHFDADTKIRGDLSHWRQVILNLAINAAEAIGEAEGAIDLAVRRIDDKVTLTVLDDGCGMDEATSDSAFEPFFSTKFTGRGLGLSAVIGVVRAHNGELSIDTEPGRGTLITVSVDAECKDEPAGPESWGTTLAEPRTVLVVDDEEAVRRLAKAMLEAAGYRVELAEDGRDALDKLRHRPYDALILDLVMPKVDGREVLSVVRQKLSHLPVVVISGYGGQLVSAKTTADPWARFLSKPFRSRDLLGALRELEVAKPETTAGRDE